MKEIITKRCKAIKEDGKKCNAWAMEDSALCFTHNPDTEEERFLASQKGGQTPKKNFNTLSPIFLDNPEDVVNLLADTINKVRAGELDIRVANCIGYLSGHLTKVFEVAQLSQRVELIEKVLSTR